MSQTGFTGIQLGIVCLSSGHLFLSVGDLLSIQRSDKGVVRGRSYGIFNGVVHAVKVSRLYSFAQMLSVFVGTLSS